jgi:hypothetical protein
MSKNGKLFDGFIDSDTKSESPQVIFSVTDVGGVIMGLGREIELPDIFAFLVETFLERGLIRIILEYYFFAPHIMMELLRLTFPLYNRPYYFNDKISYYAHEKSKTQVEWVNNILILKIEGTVITYFRMYLGVETERAISYEYFISEGNVLIEYYEQIKTYDMVLHHILTDDDYPYIVDDSINFAILRVFQRAGIIKSFPDNEKFSNIENWYSQNHSDVCE